MVPSANKKARKGLSPRKYVYLKRVASNRAAVHVNRVPFFSISRRYQLIPAAFRSSKCLLLFYASGFRPRSVTLVANFRSPTLRRSNNNGTPSGDFVTGAAVAAIEIADSRDR